MPNNDFSNNFERYTQCYSYVGVFRNKDSTKFDYSEASQGKFLTGITSFVEYIEIENSIDMAFRVGKIGINDIADVRKVLPLMGNEIIYIEYNNVITAQATVSTNKKGFFRIMGIEESKDDFNSSRSSKTTSRHLTLFLAEFPYVDILTFNGYNKSYTWGAGTASKAPGGTASISRIVNDMFTDSMTRNNINNNGISLYIQPTSDVTPQDRFNYYSPNWSILKNINFLKRFALSRNGNYSYYYLNCEQDKITFQSAYTNYLDKINRNKNRIEFVPLEISSLIPFYDISPADATNTLMDVNFKYGNAIDGMFSGFSGETFFSFDYYNGHKFDAYDYRLFKQETPSNDKYFINYQKFGDQSNKMSYSPFTVGSLNQNLKKYEYSKKSFNSMICEATAFVNNSRYLGQSANIVLPPSSQTTKNLIDPILGANWCIWGYKDVISANTGICKITLKKDSTDIPYSGMAETMLPATS